MAEKCPSLYRCSEVLSNSAFWRLLSRRLDQMGEGRTDLKLGRKRGLNSKTLRGKGHERAGQRAGRGKAVLRR